MTAGAPLFAVDHRKSFSELSRLSGTGDPLVSLRSADHAEKVVCITPGSPAADPSDRFALAEAESSALLPPRASSAVPGLVSPTGCGAELVAEFLSGFYVGRAVAGQILRRVGCDGSTHV